ncbi:MAG: dihydrolipoamide acetyltransferase family protein [Phycisphaerales bacterium]
MPDFKLPDLGEGVHEGQIVRLCAPAGASIREDDPLMEVETDKAAVEIPSPFTGTIEKWHVAEGQLVHVGDVMVTVATTAASAGKAAASSQVSKAAESSTATAPPPAATASTAVLARPHPGRHTPASPATRKLARVKGIELETINGSGPGGRVTRADVENAARAPTSAKPSRTGPKAAAAPPRQPASFASLPGESASDNHGPLKHQPLSQARKAIASAMTQSWSTIPHVTDADDADVTELEQLRKGYPAPSNGNRKLTMLAFVVRAVAQALTRHPIFNGEFEAENQRIVYKGYINIAVGVHTERGLIAPVIRDTAALSVIEIADALDAIIAKARSATFTVNETRGGTYSISNAGAFGGSHYSTPLITPGQCAVLAVGRSRMMPWVVDDSIVPRLIMPLSHSFDHRIADGGQEIAFLQDVIQQLEHPARLLL